MHYFFTYMQIHISILVHHFFITAFKMYRYVLFKISEKGKDHKFIEINLLLENVLIFYLKNIL